MEADADSKEDAEGGEEASASLEDPLRFDARVPRDRACPELRLEADWNAESCGSCQEVCKGECKARQRERDGMASDGEWRGRRREATRGVRAITRRPVALRLVPDNPETAGTDGGDRDRVRDWTRP